MNVGWVNKQFEDCVDKVTYTNKIQRSDFLETGKIPVVSQEQGLINGYWDDLKDVFKVKKPVVVFGDHTRIIKYVDFDFVLGADGVKVLLPTSDLNTRYFYYFMLSLEIKQLGYARHYRVLKESLVPVPPLSEQKQIVSILDEVFEGIAKAKVNAEKNLANAREMFESYLQSIDAEKKDLGLLVDIKTGKLDANAAVENGEYPFFTCAREIYAIDKYAFDCEAILLAGNNAVGDFNVKHYAGKFNAYQRTYVLTIKEKDKVIYRYLYYQLLRSLKEFKAKSVGAGTKFLKIGMIQNFQLALPSIDQQKTIVSKLDKLAELRNQLENIYLNKIEDFEELKKSILQKAFSGDLIRRAS